MAAAPQAGVRAPRSARSSLYRLAGAAAIAGVGFAIVQIVIEIIGVGVLGIPVPSTVAGWFSLLQDNRLLGLTELTALQTPLFALLIPVFLALHAALRRASPASAAIATALALVGIAVYLASNTALSMASLSDRYAAATTEAQRTTLVAAGEAMLAIYEGPGLDAGLSLVLAATLILSAIMLRSRVFSALTAAVGIVAGVIGLAYYVAVALPTMRILLLEAAGLFFLLWIALIARRLFQLAQS